MKNRPFEHQRRQARQYHRNRRGDHFENGILVRHVYDDRESGQLSWWDDVQFIRGKMRINVAWQHPRFVYQSLIEEAAMAATQPLYEKIDGGLFDDAVKLHKRIGRSRKKVSGYRTAADRPGEREWFDVFRAEQERLGREAEFSVRTSFNVQQLNWCRFVDIVAPIEVRSIAELRALADLVRRILAHETTLQGEFPGYVYGKAQWIADGLAAEAPRVISHRLAGISAGVLQTLGLSASVSQTDHH